MQYSLVLPRKRPSFKTPLNACWWAWKVDLDIIGRCLGFAWVFLTELGSPDRCPTRRALLRAASTSPRISTLSHQTVLGWMEATRAAAHNFAPDSRPASRRSLPGLFQPAVPKPCDEQWKTPTTPLPRKGKGNFYPRHRQEKAAPRDITGTPLVPNRHAKDNFSWCINTKRKG